jgi:type II secretory pathway component GspD/PulD (secretin)
MFRTLPIFCGIFAALSTFAAPAGMDSGNVQKVHFIQDDAQDYMVSKLYKLKYTQANDLVPFVMGMTMRYNINSAADPILGANNEQILSVTCPVEMMPYVDDFIAKVDRNVQIDGKTPGDIIRGTGITRAVYQPRYRSGEGLVNILVNSVIGIGPAGAVYAYDQNSNQIYWKDNSSNTPFVFEFLTFIDRPAPQIVFELKLYEVRESMLRDLGIEYLAWKNGPGLNIFQTAFDAFSLSSGGTAALQAVSGPVGGFFFAPQFDASFIRLLEQKGSAKITNTAMLSVSNSDTDSYRIFFNPQLQNIVKSNNDQTSVNASNLNLPEGMNQLYLRIDQPIVNIHYGASQSGYAASETFSVEPYKNGAYSQYPGTVFFAYSLQSATVMERSNTGEELVNSCVMESSVLLDLNKEFILGQWNTQQEVEQTIGVPWLSEIPILKYLFSTTTVQRENCKLYLTITPRLLNTAEPSGIKAGELFSMDK